MYLHLARASERRGRLHVRDRLLLLSAVIAARMELATVAAYCRHQILQHNPRHMLRRWHVMDEAIADGDFLHLLKQVQRQYPLEKAERMLQQLGIEMAQERDAYYTDEEYAAALLGSTPDGLRDATE